MFLWTLLDWFSGLFKQQIWSAIIKGVDKRGRCSCRAKWYVGTCIYMHRMVYGLVCSAIGTCTYYTDQNRPRYVHMFGYICLWTYMHGRLGKMSRNDWNVPHVLWSCLFAPIIKPYIFGAEFFSWWMMNECHLSTMWSMIESKHWVFLALTIPFFIRQLYRFELMLLVKINKF